MDHSTEDETVKNKTDLTGMSENPKQSDQASFSGSKISRSETMIFEMKDSTEMAKISLQKRTKPAMPLKKPVDLITLDQVEASISNSAESQIKPPNVETGNLRLKSFYQKRIGQYEMASIVASKANFSQPNFSTHATSINQEQSVSATMNSSAGQNCIDKSSILSPPPKSIGQVQIASQKVESLDPDCLDESKQKCYPTSEHANLNLFHDSKTLPNSNRQSLANESSLGTKNLNKPPCPSFRPSPLKIETILSSKDEILSLKEPALASILSLTVNNDAISSQILGTLILNSVNELLPSPQDAVESLCLNELEKSTLNDTLATIINEEKTVPSSELNFVTKSSLTPLQFASVIQDTTEYVTAESLDLKIQDDPVIPSYETMPIIFVPITVEILCLNYCLIGLTPTSPNEEIINLVDSELLYLVNPLIPSYQIIPNNQDMVLPETAHIISLSCLDELMPFLQDSELHNQDLIQTVTSESFGMQRLEKSFLIQIHSFGQEIELTTSNDNLDCCELMTHLNEYALHSYPVTSINHKMVVPLTTDTLSLYCLSELVPCIDFTFPSEDELKIVNKDISRLNCEKESELPSIPTISINQEMAVYVIHETFPLFQETLFNQEKCNKSMSQDDFKCELLILPEYQTILVSHEMIAPVTAEITGLCCIEELVLPLKNTPLDSSTTNDSGIYCQAKPLLILFRFTLVIQDLTLSENLGLDFVDDPLPPALLCNSVEHKINLHVAVDRSVEIERFELKGDKRNFKTCSICESETSASKLYYGGHSCFRCISFFKRALQNSTFERFQCSEGNCKIDSKSWRCCKWCRFQMCLQIGMIPDLVVGNSNPALVTISKKKPLQEAFQEVGPKNRLEIPSLKPPKSGASKVLTFGLSEDEIFQIKEICHQSQKIVLNHVIRFYATNPTLFKILTSCIYFNTEFRNLQIIFPSSLAKAVLEEMATLHSADISILLRTNYPKVVNFIHSILMIKSEDFLTTTLAFLINKSLNLSPDDVSDKNLLVLHEVLKELKVGDKLSDRALTYFQFWAKHIQHEDQHSQIVVELSYWQKTPVKRLDIIQIFLMTMILNLSTEHVTVRNPKKINKLQAQYLTMLQQYLKYKFRADAKEHLENVLKISSIRL